MFGSRVKTQKFHLSASPCAPKGYPAMIQLGNFVRSDGKTFPVPSGHFLDGTWGDASIGWSVGDEDQPAPESLELLWYAFAEDKFYEGRLPLPQEKIHALLKEGYWNSSDNKAETYARLLVCVLPKGAVVVWLRGQNQVLVGRFQAQEATVNFATYYRNADRAKMVREEQVKLPAEVRQHIASGTVSAARWDAYLTKYNWQLELRQSKADKAPVLYDYSIDYLSGERTRYPTTRDLAPFLQTLLTPTPKPVPKGLTAYVRDAWGRKRRLKIETFDEAEMQGAFQALQALHPAATITLRVEADENFQALRFLLSNDRKQLELTKVKAKVVDLK